MIMAFQCIFHDSLYEYVEEFWREQATLSHSNCGSEPVSYAVISVVCTGGFVVQILYQFGQIAIDVVQLHGGPQCCMPNPVKCLLEVHKNVVEVLLMLKVPLTCPEVENLFCYAASCLEACLFFSDDPFCLWLQSVQ